MPASNFNLYLQDARNNFDAVRPAPICIDDQQSKGGYHNIHVSMNCYHGYHNLNSLRKNHVDTDCEMADVAAVQNSGTSKINSKKRCAEEQHYPQTKRLRDDDSSMCSLVGTRSSPSHSASAFNINIPTFYTLYLICRFLLKLCVT